MNDLALWLKALHILAFIAWMAGLLYLPRLFVYHCQVAPGTEASDKFKIMERRLLREITTPAMVATLLFGVSLGIVQGQWSEGWLHVKLLLVLGLAAAHGFMARYVKAFAAD
jgi:putative membrane protein